MAHGLSDLQKGILILAYNNREDWPYLLPGHVLFNIYGLPLQKEQLTKAGKQRKTRFDRQSIGDQYAAANVAVSKAFRRLQDRGLMEVTFVDRVSRYMNDANGEKRIYQRGVKLTPSGMETAEKLLGKTTENLVLPNSERG